MGAVVVDFPTASPPPRPTGDSYVDSLELQIIRGVVAFVVSRYPLDWASGLAQARETYLLQHPDLDGGEHDHSRYLSLLVIAVQRMSTRQREKLKHPARSRTEAQTLLEGNSL